MVRAKIHCIGGQLERTVAHVDLACHYMQPHRPLLVLMHGVSGSGKSYVAAELVTILRAVRVRSDVERKRLFGLRPLESSSDALKAEMYGSKGSAMVLERVLQVTETALLAQWSVVVDATTLKRSWRQACRELCERAGGRFVLVHCRAEMSVLRERVRVRKECGGDPSEAGEEVLEKQLAGEEPLGEDEPHVTLDTSRHVTPGQVAQFAAHSIADK
jgi:predicted kinase